MQYRVIKEKLVNKTKSWHRCNICERLISPGEPAYTVIVARNDTLDRKTYKRKKILETGYTCYPCYN